MGAKTKIDWDGTEWYEIPDHEDYYAAMDGRILSLKRLMPHEMKQMATRDGHRYVFMYSSKNRMAKVWVHRAVLSAYCGEDKHGMLCRHLDDDPTNNRVSNLSWGTIQDNMNDRKVNKGYPRGANATGAKLNEQQVMAIRTRYAKGERSRVLAAEFGVSRNAVTEIVRGKTWSDLPLVEAEVKHSARRLTPISAEHARRFAEGGRRYAASKRKLRHIVECACGCGRLIETPDAKGRERKYCRGHNTEGRHWRWKKGAKHQDIVV